MQVTVRKKEREYVFQCMPGERLLYAGLRAGVPLPYECSTGTCGTCRGRLKDGDIECRWEQAPGIGKIKPDRGEFLMCQSVARSECAVAIPGSMAPFRDDDVVPAYHDASLGNWRQLTRDVRAFTVDLPSDVAFHAGQYFVIETPAVPGFRAYSMTNYSARTRQLEFIIKKLPGGGFSEWAFSQNATDTPVSLFGPLGRATFHPDEGRDLFLVGGGSGIAGLMSILGHASECGHLDRHRATLHFGVRTREDLFFEAELSRLVARHPANLSVNIVYSELGPADLPGGESQNRFSFASGYVHAVAIESLKESRNESHLPMVYLAGPPPMVDAAIRSLMLEAGVTPGDIRYDKFA